MDANNKLSAAKKKDIDKAFLNFIFPEAMGLFFLKGCSLSLSISNKSLKI